MGKLQLPINRKFIVPRCCLTCVYRIQIEEKSLVYPMNNIFSVCKRDAELLLEDEPEYYACDGYKINKEIK